MRIAAGTEATEGCGPAATQAALAGDLNPQFLSRHGILPISDDGSELIVEMADPTDVAAVAALAFATRRTVVPRARCEAAHEAARTQGGKAGRSAPTLLDQLLNRIGGGGGGRCLRLVEALADTLSDGRDIAEALDELERAGAGPSDRVRRVRGLVGTMGIGVALAQAAGLPAWGAAILDQTTIGPRLALEEIAARIRRAILSSAALWRGLAVPLSLAALMLWTAGSWGLVAVALLGVAAVARPREWLGLHHAADRLGIVTAGVASGLAADAAAALVTGSAGRGHGFTEWLASEGSMQPAERRRLAQAEQSGGLLAALREVSARRDAQADLALAEEARWWTMASLCAAAVLMISGMF